LKWKEKFFLLCPARIVDFDHLLCKIFELWNFELLHHHSAHHVRYMCTNLRGRGWVEHTQIHLALKKGTNFFHYISNSCGIFSDFTFHGTKIPIVDMKIHVYSNFSKKIWKWNLQAPWGMEDFTLPNVGVGFKKWRSCTPILPKCQAHPHNTQKKWKKMKKLPKKRG
jgi:hypothetical protein